MLGWNISVYRQDNDGSLPATTETPRSSPIAIWQGSWDAARWLHDLVQEGTVIDLGGDGYPSHMTAKAGAVLPVIRRGPPFENEIWISGPEDILGPEWHGKTVFDSDEADRCRDNEWLYIQLWDES